MLGLAPLTPAYPFPFPPPPTAKRANTLLLKNRLVELLPAAEGEAYWNLLCNLLTGKITREEFDIGWRKSVATPELEAHQISIDDVEYLHNSLLLSILYNTTKPTLPPASVSHQGWTSKRKRGMLLSAEEQGTDILGELSRKRRKVKRLVAGMTKGEKKRLKVLLNATSTTVDKKSNAPAATTSSKLGVGATASGLKTPGTAAFQQELLRCQATPSCLEALELPDLPTLNDRMSAVAYSSGIAKGVDAEASGLAAVALDIYMKDLISALVQSIPSAGSTSSQETGKPKPKKTRITNNHISTLLSLSPSLLHSRQLSSIERHHAHGYLWSAPTREHRLKYLEQAQTDKIALKDALIDERQSMAVESEVKPEEERSLEEKSTTVNADSNLSGSADAKGKEALPADQLTADEQDALSKLMSIDASVLSAGISSEAPAASLEAELFPELPTVSTPKTTSPAKETSTAKSTSVTHKENAYLEPADTVSSDDEDEARHKAAKSSDKRQDRSTDKRDRGRLGLWKILTGILEGGVQVESIA